jgi:F-type H+-transporting ATPase subunit epsilon
MATAPGRQVQCVVVTPEQAVLDEAVDFVALPMYDGELGVLPGRAPLIGRLGPGELRTRRGTQTHRYFVDGGFAQVRADVVTVLTPRAVPAGEINLKDAEHILEEAKKPARQGESAESKLKAQEKARAQIRVARKKDSPGT